VSLFLFTFVLSQLVATPLFAQDLRNRTEEMYPFGTVIISSESLPDKVYEAQKDKIMVSAIFIEKETNKVFINSVGTGFITKSPGIVVTARHVFDQSLVDAESIKSEKIKSNPQFDYTYEFKGTIITDRAWVKFSLYLVAIGEKGTFKDIMILRADPRTMEKAMASGDLFNPNPYSILMRTSKFADAKVGDKVYISGFAPGVTEYFDKDNKVVPVYMDLVNHTFIAEVEALLPEMPGNKTEVKTIYRLRNGAEQGFSGGKVLNDKGQVIGMTIAMSREKNFVYAISSDDIEQLLKDNKLK
jgi:hypothetical protein